MTRQKKVLFENDELGRFSTRQVILLNQWNQQEFFFFIDMPSLEQHEMSLIFYGNHCFNFVINWLYDFIEGVKTY